MEGDHCLSALTYKGSIPQAIIESKNQKKLFVVYISGSDDAASLELERSTWTESKVAESLSKYCILLHLTEGSPDAVNFSAIYPYKIVPSIIAIGYNGVQLWQNEGFVTAEVLASTLEKAWLSLHIQDTTATVLTAALAAKKPELSASTSSDVGLSGEGSTSGIAVSNSADKHAQSSDARRPAAAETTKENYNCEVVEEKSTEDIDEQSPKSSNAVKSKSSEPKDSTSSTKEAKGLPIPMVIDQNDSFAEGMTSSSENDPVEEKISTHHSGGGGDSHIATNETNKEMREEGKDDIACDDKRVNTPSDVYLNIRLPSGANLQDKFSLTSTLRMVIDYVDRNQSSGLGSYNLAIPYPRKVFNNEDLNKSLSELGLFNRQALIVVPHQKSTSYLRGGSSSDQATIRNSDSTTASNGGYFAYIRSILSFINPLSYLGGNTSSSNPERPQPGMWEYSPNPALQNNPAREERPYSSNLQNRDSSASGRNDIRNRQPTTSRIGSNIHTLKHDEDDGRFDDRNAFWNGNSTQYGGNNDGK
ncbi:plant UBX domain-containing protein 11 [Mercurialis annua]|uniref:plant UBX domain-containing protein 11 n=1 Tax=Mercurialis annua TaxID=3986 RepID=UPI002160C327|nr:plant UBX domain-containing protein 11 [Mercurialis annua]